MTKREALNKQKELKSKTGISLSKTSSSNTKKPVTAPTTNSNAKNISISATKNTSTKPNTNFPLDILSNINLNKTKVGATVKKTGTTTPEQKEIKKTTSSQSLSKTSPGVKKTTDTNTKTIVKKSVSQPNLNSTKPNTAKSSVAPKQVATSPVNKTKASPSSVKASSTPKKSTVVNSNLKATTSKATTSKATTPKATTPKATTPKATTPKATSTTKTEVQKQGIFKKPVEAPPKKPVAAPKTTSATAKIPLPPIPQKFTLQKPTTQNKSANTVASKATTTNKATPDISKIGSINKRVGTPAKLEQPKVVTKASPATPTTKPTQKRKEPPATIRTPLPKRPRRITDDEYDLDDDLIDNDGDEYQPGSITNFIKSLNLSKGPTGVKDYKALDSTYDPYNPGMGGNISDMSDDGDIDDMETSFLDIAREESKSATQAIKEDKEERKKLKQERIAEKKKTTPKKKTKSV